MNEQQNEKKSGGRVNTATKLISRVIRYMLHYYKYPFILVIVCILITAIATVVGATFPRRWWMITLLRCSRTAPMISAALLRI